MFRALTIAALVVVASAAPAIIYGSVNEGYGQRTESNSHERCPRGLARRADGECVEPIINRSIYLYNAPKPTITYLEPDYIPTPKVNYNYVFVRTANAVVEKNPIIIPPAQQRTLVYVLNKQLEKQQEVIQLEGKRDEPQVHFVNYKDGENQYLPGGVDLETALGLTPENGHEVSEGETETAYSQSLRTYWRHNDEEEEASDESSESSSEEDSSEEDSDEEDSEEEEEDDEEHENESEYEQGSENEQEEGSEQEGGEEQQVAEEGGEEEQAVAEVDVRTLDLTETNQVEEAEPKKEEITEPKKRVSAGFPPAYILN